MIRRRLFGLTRRTNHVTSLLAPGLLAVLAIGCGGSSGTSLGPAAKFLGRWEIDLTAPSSFKISCPVIMLSGSAAVWGEMVFEKGVLTDATEASGNCLPPGLGFDVNGSKLSVANPDPYTGAAPICELTLGADANGLPVYLDLSFTALDLTLLKPVSGEAPTALLTGTATGAVAQDDGTGMGHYVQVDTCTYSGTGDTFHRMSQP
jgi:hypothetical protein